MPVTSSVGYGLSKRGAAVRFPVLHFWAYQATLPFCPNLFQLNHKILARWFTAVRCRRLAGRFSLCFGTFLSSRCPSFLHQVRQPLSTRRCEIVPLFLGASHSIGNSSHPCGGFWCLAVQCCYGSTKSVSLPLQLRYDSSRIQGALLVQDFESASVGT
jgi:hypothetical protein